MPLSDDRNAFRTRSIDVVLKEDKYEQDSVICAAELKLCMSGSKTVSVSQMVKVNMDLPAYVAVSLPFGIANLKARQPTCKVGSGCVGRRRQDQQTSRAVNARRRRVIVATQREAASGYTRKVESCF